MSNKQHLNIIADIDHYYSDKLSTHGATPQGVDWSSKQSQELRFSQLLKICDCDNKFTLIDFGCGYGALYSYLSMQRSAFSYVGIDISNSMIDKARMLHDCNPNCVFCTTTSELKPAEYCVASGVFNVRIEHSLTDWEEYIYETLAKMDKLATKGFAFNCLTKYSDKERMRPDLYYSDPCVIFDYCKRNFSRNIALFHDYGLYEFTILVRKEIIQ